MKTSAAPYRGGIPRFFKGVKMQACVTFLNNMFQRRLQKSLGPVALKGASQNSSVSQRVKYMQPPL